MSLAPAPLPETWLTRLGGLDASGWVTRFHADPAGAVADLLWGRFYFGPLNPADRGQLLAGWLDALGDSEGFALRLDHELAKWVETNWGRFDQPAEMLASAWSCLAGVVESSAKLPSPCQLEKTAVALRERFSERDRFLGCFSTAPAADPLGLYLACVAEFQGEDRSLIGFWHRLCGLPDGVRFYHARYAMLGLQRVKSASRQEDGSLRAEVVLGLLRLAVAFDRLVRERGLDEAVARTTFSRLASQLASAYPNSPRWSEHGLAAVLQLPERPQRWVLENVLVLDKAAKKERARTNHVPSEAKSSVEPDATWTQRARALASSIHSLDANQLRKAKRLLDEQRAYAEATGDSYFLVRSLCNFASRVLPFEPELAARWVDEARQWEPQNPFTWTTTKDVLLRQEQLDRALDFAWVAWKRFPENNVVRNGLAEVLKAAWRLEDAEEVYRETAERFPKNDYARSGLAGVLRAAGRYVEAEEVCRKAIADFPAEVVPRTSLAAVLRAAGRYAEAEAEYRTINKDFPDAAVPFVGLAYLLLRQGAKHRAEVLNLVSTALKLDPKNRYAVRLQSQLVTAPGEALAAIADEWDTVVGQLLEGSPRYHDVATDDSRQEIRPADAGETQDLDPCTPPSADVDSRDTDARSTQPPKPIVDPVHLAALLAEASFYRAWAVRSAPEAAEQLRERAEDCLARAEGLAPGDVCVAAEYAALEAAHVPPEKLDRRLAVELGKYPASTRLLVLKARVEREQARLSQRRLTEESLAELLLAPARLRALDPSLVPVFHLQRGLAALALTNGDMRRQKAAEGFESFRRVVARRAAEERADREASRDFRAAGMLGFHEWLCETTEARLFRGLPVQGEVSAESVQALEQSLPAARALFEEVEEVMVGRLVFSSV